MKDPIYDRWGDLLHETPEAEGPLRDYVQREADRAWLEHKRERSRQAALRHIRTSTREERIAEACRIAERTRALRAQPGDKPGDEVGE